MTKPELIKELESRGVQLKGDEKVTELKALLKDGEPEYKVVVKLNDQVFEAETNNLEETIQSFAPEFVKTKVIIQVTKGDKTLERVLFGNQAKLLFINRIALGVLVRSLLF